MNNGKADYIQGHSEPVVRWHSARTAENSAAYLLPHLQPNMKILDVGCGPGSITVGLASHVPGGKVIGLENTADILTKAKQLALSEGVKNVEFELGDATSLPYPDNSFDVVHAHQVLQHTGDPVRVLSEMRRVTKKGGLVACREADVFSSVFYPHFDGLDQWFKMLESLSKDTKQELRAGRQLKSWARKAGFELSQIELTGGMWVFESAEQRKYWASVWIDRYRVDTYRKRIVDGGHASEEELATFENAFLEWAKEDDGWYSLVHGQVVCKKE